MAVTTDVLKVVGLIGHSNGQGFGGSTDMLTDYPHLWNGASPTDTNTVWKNVYVFTNAHGYPSPAGTPSSYAVSDGAWLEMTVNNPVSPAAPHPHPSPYAYPNVEGGPYPNWTYEADTFLYGTGALTGLEIPLMWHLSSYWGDEVGLIKLAIPGTLFLRYDQGYSAEISFDRYSYINSPAASRPESTIDSSFGYNAWWTPRDQFDWAPNTSRLYASFIAKCVAARAALLPDTTMSMDVVVCWFGDNDASKTRERVQFWEDDVRSFVKRLRHDISENSLSTLPEHQVRIIWMGVKEEYSGADDNQSYMNEAAQRVADDDPYMTFLDADDFTCHATDESHLNHVGYVEAAAEVFDAIRDLDIEPYDALDADDRVSVETLKERVRLYYTRGKTNTDVGAELLLQHLNGAMHHIVAQCADNAWFLRRRMEISLSGGGVANPVTLPRMVHRIVKIEQIGDATYPIEFTMLGHVEGGRLQIVMPESASGTFHVHFIRTPRDLETDAELAPIPKALIEWLVVETCFRLARAASNPAAIATFQTAAMQLHADVLKSVSTMQRSKKDRLYTQRRLPDVLHRRRRRQWDNP